MIKKKREQNLIIILAGGNKNKDEPNDFVKIRLDKAIELFYIETKILCMGGGTYHKPPDLTYNGFVKHESTICANYLINKGIPCDSIFREWASYDTIANGFFAFTNFIIPLNICKFSVITSDFHINRTKLIFNYFNKIFKSECEISFISTVSKLEKKNMEERESREAKSAKDFQENIINKIKTLNNFCLWFYTKHNSYKSKLEFNYNLNSNNHLKNTY